MIRFGGFQGLARVACKTHLSYVISLIVESSAFTPNVSSAPARPRRKGCAIYYPSAGGGAAAGGGGAPPSDEALELLEPDDLRLVRRFFFLEKRTVKR